MTDHEKTPDTHTGSLTKILLTDEGFDPTPEGRSAFLDQFGLEGEMPGICIACNFTHMSCEPDLKRGLCEGCGERTVSSALVLWGLIS